MRRPVRSHHVRASCHYLEAHVLALLRVRRERQRRGWTQQELADCVGVRRATVSDLERRISATAQLWLIERIAKALEGPAARLIE